MRIEAAEPQLRVENSTKTDFYDNFQFSIFNSQLKIIPLHPQTTKMHLTNNKMDDYHAENLNL